MLNHKLNVAIVIPAYNRGRFIAAAIEAEIKYRIGRLFGKPEAWIGDLKRASVCWGQLFPPKRKDRKG
jgi:hypothetical protein